MILISQHGALLDRASFDMPWYCILNLDALRCLLIAAPIGLDKNQMPTYWCSAKIWLVMCISRPESALWGMRNTVFGSAVRGTSVLARNWEALFPALLIFTGLSECCPRALLFLSMIWCWDGDSHARKKTRLTSVSFGRSCHLSVLQRLAIEQHRRYRDFSLGLLAVTPQHWFFVRHSNDNIDKWSYCRFMTILNFYCAASHGEVAAIQNWQCTATSLGQGAHGEKWTCEKRFIAVRNSWGSSFARKAWSGAYISDNTDFTSR